MFTMGHILGIRKNDLQKLIVEFSTMQSAGSECDHPVEIHAESRAAAERKYRALARRKFKPKKLKQ